MTIQPSELRYCPTHEWAHAIQDGGKNIAVIGISAFAVEQLTDLVFMALPKVGSSVQAGQEFGEVESVKAVSPLYSPVSGQVVAVNESLPNQLEILSRDPYNEGWMIQVEMSDLSELDGLLTFESYSKQCAESH